MNKKIINDNKLSLYLLKFELDNVKYVGTYNQHMLSHNSIIFVENRNVNKQIIIPKMNCLLAFEHSDLTDNGFYNSKNIDNNIAYYMLETLRGSYIDNDNHYIDNYAVAPFVKNLNI